MTPRRTLAALLAVLATLALSAPAGADPSHGWDVKCGQSFDDGFGWFDAKGYNVACSVVRRAANNYVFGGDPSPKGWGRCDEDQIGDEVWRVDCKRRKNGEHQHVRFKFGA
jgi:hypothetical protein